MLICLSLISELPHIKVSRGMVVRYVPASNAFLPVREGEVVKVDFIPVLSSSELVVSFVGKAAVRFGENSRAVLGPLTTINKLLILETDGFCLFESGPRSCKIPQFCNPYPLRVGRGNRDILR